MEEQQITEIFQGNKLDVLELKYQPNAVLKVMINGVEQTIGNFIEDTGKAVYVDLISRKLYFNCNAVPRFGDKIEVIYNVSYSNIRRRIDKVLKNAVQKFGIRSQTLKAAEEANELSRAIVKSVNHGNEDEYVITDDVIDELADVIIMCKQLEIVMDMIPDAMKKLNERVLFKVDRLEKRVNEWI